MTVVIMCLIQRWARRGKLGY